MKLLRKTRTLLRLMWSGETSLIYNRIRLLLVLTVQSKLPDKWRTIFVRDARVYHERTGSEIVPKISVVVPNYNHAAYLRQRLDSIYSQSHALHEVILLDDCSSDASRVILEEYKARHPALTQLHFNLENSGGVYRQWAKGIGLATGDLVWIAESDDFCEPDFLERLALHFRDESVMLAYGRSDFVDANGVKTGDSETYLSDVDVVRWTVPFTRSAQSEVAYGFGSKNFICNVSGALFRKPTHLGLLNESTWRELRICGDWIFYLHLMRGGTVAYDPRASNSYRVHAANTSSATYKQDSYYRELGMVWNHVSSLYKVDEIQRGRLETKALAEFKFNRPDEPESTLRSIFSIRESSSLPTIAVCGYAFTSGGGEIFPIRLANLLRAKGYGVTFINFDLDQRNNEVRSLLRDDVPLINLRGLTELRSLLEHFAFDVIHSHHAHVDILVEKACEGLSVAHFVTLHGMYEGETEEFWLRHLPSLTRNVKCWAYLTEKNLRAFKAVDLFDSGRFVCIPNAAEATPFRALSRRSLDLPEDAFVVCLVSRAIREKGWLEAIECVRQARDLSGRDIRLLLVGDGPHLQEVRASAPSFVVCLGFRKNTLDYFATSDLGILPTYFAGESYPLVVMDCLNTGRPMLSTNVGAIRSMLETEDGEAAGEAFDLTDGKVPVRAMAEKLARHACDPSFHQKQSQVAVQAARKFDPQRMVRAYEKLYERSLGYQSYGLRLKQDETLVDCERSIVT